MATANNFDSKKSLSNLRKKYKSAGYSNALEFYDDMGDRLRIPSRCVWLNDQLGGGLCYGTFTEIAGYESSGKSLLAKDFAYVTQQLGGVVLWADCERCFDFVWAKKNGLTLDRIELLKTEAIEVISDWFKDSIKHWRSMLTNNEPILFVCDSIAALETLENLEADEIKGKAEMGNRAKGIYRFYRRRNNILEKYGVVGIMINQVRKKVGATMFEAAETMPGGDSTRFYSSNRIMVTRSKQIKGYLDEKGKWQDSKEKGKKIGQNVKVDVYKNKTSPPKPAVMTEVYFQDKKYEYVGFNRYSNVEELLLEAGVITKKGSRYYYGEEMLCNGEANFNPLMHSKPRLRKKLLDALDLNTISKTRARIGAIGKNLYPIKSKKSNEDGDDE